jgi:hypothetical protein
MKERARPRPHKFIKRAVLLTPYLGVHTPDIHLVILLTETMNAQKYATNVTLDKMPLQIF